MIKADEKKGIILLTAGLGLLLVFFAFVPVFAGAAELKDIRIANNKEHLLLYYNVDGCFTEEMEAAIHNGIGTTFNFFARVYRVKRFWWDKKVSDLKVYHHVKYDNLKKVYILTLSEDGDRKLCVQDLQTVKRLMSEIRGLKVARLEDLHPGENYHVSMMAELDTITLPFKLHYVLFFLSLWDFETDWYSLDFVY